MSDTIKGPGFPGTAQALRDLAERRLNERAGELPEALHTLSAEESRKLLHELRVHQIELEMQNEELRRVQELLQASKARYMDLYDRAPVGYISVDGNGIVRDSNLTAARLLGLGIGEIAGQPLTRFIMPEDQDLYYLHRRQMEKCDSRECELRLLRAGAQPFWALMDATVLRIDGKEPECRIAISDITEWRKAEAEKQRLANLLAQKKKEIYDFLYLTTHDLRGPLVSMQGFSRNLLKDFDNLMAAVGPALKKADADGSLEKLTEHSIPAALNFIADGAVRTHQLLETMLKVYRVGRVGGPPEDLDADASLKSVLFSLRYQIEESGCEVKAGQLPKCSAVPGTLTPIFSNIITNAIQFRDRNRKLVITISGEKKSGGKVLYTLSDNGIGMDKECLAKIFQLFFRCETPGVEKGEGIGLPLALTLAEQSGGRIWAESKEGEGSTFFVELPE